MKLTPVAIAVRILFRQMEMEAMARRRASQPPAQTSGASTKEVRGYANSLGSTPGHSTQP